MDSFEIQKKKNVLNISKIALAGVFLSSFIACIDLTVISTAIPAIKAFFLPQENILQWVIVGLMVTLSSTMILAGKLADIFGAKKLLLYGLAILFLGSLIASLSEHHKIGILITGRIIQGIGIAILYTSPPAIINENFPKAHVGKIMGYYFGVNGLGMALGPIIGSLIIYYLNWRAIFIVNLPLTVICFALVYVFLKNDRTNSDSNDLDIIGAFLLVSGLAAMLMLLTNIHNWGVSSYQTFMTFVFCIVIFCVFYRNEQEIDKPIISFSIFKNTNFSLSCICNAGLAAMYGTTLFFFPQVLEQEKNFHSPYIGLMMLFTTASLATTSIFINKIVKQRSFKFVLSCGFLLLCISSSLFAFTSKDTSLLLIAFSLCLFGIGWGFILSPSITLGLTSTPIKGSANSMGIIGTAHNLGGAVGLSLSVLFVDYLARQNLNDTFFIPFLFSAIIGFLVLCYLFIKHRQSTKN